MGALAVVEEVLAADDGLVGAEGMDETVVTEVVQGIKAAQSRHGFALAREIGRLIVDRFHAGDMEAFRSRGAKDASLRKLAQHQDLPMSASALHNAVAAFDYAERNPGVYLSKHLTPTHVRTVIALPAPEQDRLLAEAENKALTVEQLAAEARKAAGRAKKKTGGRPTLPAFVRSIHALEKYANGDQFGGLEAVETLKVEDARTLLETVTALQSRCEALAGRLAARATAEGSVAAERVNAPRRTVVSAQAAKSADATAVLEKATSYGPS